MVSFGKRELWLSVAFVCSSRQSCITDTKFLRREIIPGMSKLWMEGAMARAARAVCSIAFGKEVCIEGLNMWESILRAS